MQRIAVFLAGLMVLVIAAGGSLAAESRIALVIGNGAYANVPKLTNPTNDAAVIAASLEAVGFGEVSVVENADYQTLRLALREFSRKVATADIAVVYFAGHGIEVGGANYLIPTDAKLAEAGDVEFEAINFETVMNAMSDARKLRLFVLDACRDNPFAVRMKSGGGTRSVGRGLARIEPQSNTLVAYAAKSGTQALDGDGANSPFAVALASELVQPGVEIGYVFRRVRDKVMEETGGRQEPFTYGSLGGEAIFLTPEAPSPVASPAVAPAPAPTPTTGRAPDPLLTEAAAAWPAVQDTTSIGVLKAYIARYDGTVFADLASARLVEVEVAAGAASAPGPAPSAAPSPPRQDPRIAAGPPVAAIPAPAEPRRFDATPVAVPVGKWAEGVAFDGQQLWVSESGQRTIAAVDPSTGTIKRRVKVGRLPVGMAASSNGRIFSLIHTDKIVWQQTPDGAGKQFAKIAECPEDIAASERAVWVVTWPDCSSATSRAIKIDISNGSRQAQTGILPEWGQAVAFGFGKAWVAHARNGIMSVVDSGSMAVDTASVGDASLWAVTANASGVHAGGRIGEDNGLGVIVSIDPATLSERFRHTVDGRVAEMAADDRNVVAIGDTGLVWVLNADASAIESVITLSTGGFTASDIIIVGDTLIVSRQMDQGENGALLAISGWRP